ncbi:MAG: 1-deoxy-D-xylulose-5-phosphate reductoisomerase [Clostridiales bacterium]|nr:1-deoxy-D-xylulose-5-phosphate reductoisomerase [Clostridiales bacterium]
MASSKYSVDYSFPAIAVLGSTGSVGKQALDIARRHGVRVLALSANTNITLLEEQIREFSPDYCTVVDKRAAEDLRVAVADTKTKVLAGHSELCDMITACDAPVIINAIVGSAGLLPTLTAVREGRRVALANKESLVVGGELVMAETRRYGAEIIPVDSEHSAVFQCLEAGRREDLNRIILTASGGPFFGYTKERLEMVRLSDALAHPTWKMGAKITIDSATMMNKGFEVIEAAHLFGVAADQIDVLIHRESIIHSMVEYIDNTIIAQMGLPDMRSCVQYALSYPARAEGVGERLNLAEIGNLSFYAPETDSFPLLSVAYDALRAGGVVPAALNAADEIAVAAFLREEISFLGISEVVIRTVDRFANGKKALPALEDILEVDRDARRIAQSFIDVQGR